MPYYHLIIHDAQALCYGGKYLTVVWISCVGLNALLGYFAHFQISEIEKQER